MKDVLINSGLVVALMGLFVVPMFGFSFLKYSKPKSILNAPVVLGDKDVRKNTDFSVLDQIDVNLHLGRDTSQVFYNIVPKKYVGLGYSFIPVIPNSYKEKGLELSIVETSDGINLKASVSPDFEIKKAIPVTILVIE